MGNTNIEEINIFCCSVSGEFLEELINKLFPRKINNTKRELINKEMHYKSQIYSGKSDKKNIIKDININITNNKNNNIIICFDGNKNVESHLQYWKELVQLVNDPKKGVPIYNLPCIIFLYPFEEKIDFNQLFSNDIDKRTITILKTMKNEDNVNIEINYRLIFSLLWEKNLYFNQMKIKPSANFNANLFRFNVEPVNSINILLTGFSRCGKSTIINLIFDKLISRESLSPHPVTKNSIEYSYRQHNDENDESDSGIKIIDTPGIMVGNGRNDDNQRVIKKIINKSIQDANNIHENIHYILFLLDTSPNFEKKKEFLDFLNGIKIPVIFIINKVPYFDNIRKRVIKDYLRTNHYNNLYNNLIIGDNWDNIIEVNLIEGVKGKVNDIFKYIYLDLIKKNEFLINYSELDDDNVQEFFQNLNHKNNTLLNNVKGIDDIIIRGEKKADIAIYSFTSLIAGTGFCPIPGVDIPFYFVFLASMLTSIINSYGIKLNNTFPYKRFFSEIFDNQEAGKAIDDYSINNSENKLSQEQNQKVSKINKTIIGLVGGGTSIIATSILKIVTFRLVLLGINELFDFVPVVGWIAGGVVSAIINIPFVIKLSKNSKKFCKTLAKERTASILRNIIEGYKNAVDIIKQLSERKNWERKIQIQEKLN